MGRQDLIGAAIVARSLIATPGQAWLLTSERPGSRTWNGSEPRSVGCQEQAPFVAISSTVPSSSAPTASIEVVDDSIKGPVEMQISATHQSVYASETEQKSQPSLRRSLSC